MCDFASFWTTTFVKMDVIFTNGFTLLTWSIFSSNSTLAWKSLARNPYPISCRTTHFALATWTSNHLEWLYTFWYTEQRFECTGADGHFSRGCTVLLSLDLLDGKSLYADNEMNYLVHREVLSRPAERMKYIDRWHIPLTRHENHFTSEWNSLAGSFIPQHNFTKYIASLPIHLQRSYIYIYIFIFIFILLKRAGVQAVDAISLSFLEEIVAKSEMC